MDSSSYYIDSTADIDSSSAAAAMLVLFLIFFVIMIVFYVIFAYLLSRVFKKIGVKQSIAGIAIYNNWKMLEIGGQQGFWAVLALIPFVNIASAVFTYIAMFQIGKKFGKEDWFIILAIFLPPVWLAILAFDNSKWSDGNSINMPMNNTQPAYMPPTNPVTTQTPTTSFSDTNPITTTPNQAPEVNTQPNTTPPVTPVDNNFQQ
jgi:hypothetical protein